MKNNILLILTLILIFSGCSQIDLSKVDLSKINKSDIDKVIVCEDPYKRHGTGCCLDQNSNSICDNDEKSEPIHEKLDSTKKINSCDQLVIATYCDGFNLMQNIQKTDCSTESKIDQICEYGCIDQKPYDFIISIKLICHNIFRFSKFKNELPTIIIYTIIGIKLSNVFCFSILSYDIYY